MSPSKYCETTLILCSVSLGSELHSQGLFGGIRVTELKPFAFPLTPQQPLPSVLLSPESRVISKCFFLFGKDRTFLLHPLKAKTCCFLAPALKHRGTEGFQSNSFGWQRRFRCGPGTACIRRLWSLCQPTARSACCWDLLGPAWNCSHL